MQKAKDKNTKQKFYCVKIFCVASILIMLQNPKLSRTVSVLLCSCEFRSL